eukprot:COSAG05_NODE_5083_length_1268_cov_1.346450_1_plen_94_part_00
MCTRQAAHNGELRAGDTCWGLLREACRLPEGWLIPCGMQSEVCNDLESDYEGLRRDVCRYFGCTPACPLTRIQTRMYVLYIGYELLLSVVGGR